MSNRPENTRLALKNVNCYSPASSKEGIFKYECKGESRVNILSPRKGGTEIYQGTALYDQQKCRNISRNVGTSKVHFLKRNVEGFPKRRQPDIKNTFFGRYLNASPSYTKDVDIDEDENIDEDASKAILLPKVEEDDSLEITLPEIVSDRLKKESIVVIGSCIQIIHREDISCGPESCVGPQDEANTKIGNKKLLLPVESLKASIHVLDCNRKDNVASKPTIILNKENQVKRKHSPRKVSKTIHSNEKPPCCCHRKIGIEINNDSPTYKPDGYGTTAKYRKSSNLHPRAYKYRCKKHSCVLCKGPSMAFRIDRDVRTVIEDIDPPWKLDSLSQRSDPVPNLARGSTLEGGANDDGLAPYKFQEVTLEFYHYVEEIMNFGESSDESSTCLSGKISQSSDSDHREEKRPESPRKEVMGKEQQRVFTHDVESKSGHQAGFIGISAHENDVGNKMFSDDMDGGMDPPMICERGLEYESEESCQSLNKCVREISVDVNKISEQEDSPFENELRVQSDLEFDWRNELEDFQEKLGEYNNTASTLPENAISVWRNKYIATEVYNSGQTFDKELDSNQESLSEADTTSIRGLGPTHRSEIETVEETSNGDVVLSSSTGSVKSNKSVEETSSDDVVLSSPAGSVNPDRVAKESINGYVIRSKSTGPVKHNRSVKETSAGKVDRFSPTGSATPGRDLGRLPPSVVTPNGNEGDEVRKRLSNLLDALGRARADFSSLHHEFETLQSSPAGNESLIGQLEAALSSKEKEMTLMLVLYRALSLKN